MKVSRMLYCPRARMPALQRGEPDALVQPVPRQNWISPDATRRRGYDVGRDGLDRGPGDRAPRRVAGWERGTPARLNRLAWWLCGRRRADGHQIGGRQRSQTPGGHSRIRALRRGAPRIPVVQPTDTRQSDNLGFSCRALGYGSRRWSRLVEAEVGAVVVVVGDVIRQQSSQMALVENDDVIEQLAADAADPSLCDGIVPRAHWSTSGS